VLELNTFCITKQDKAKKQRFCNLGIMLNTRQNALQRRLGAISFGCQNGEEPGYPGFKSTDRFNSILYPSHGNGIRLQGKKLRGQHVGKIRVCLHSRS
jgi:hypothetical protein